MHIVIIGGVAGGAACAARLRRLNEDCTITIVEQGSYVSFANCGLPYYLSEAIPARESLFVTTKEALTQNFKLEVLVNTTALAIDRKLQQVTVQDNSGQRALNYDVLILSPGSLPVVPPFARDLCHVYTLRTVPDADKVKADLAHPGKKVLVVGGGFIGLECAENLVAAGAEVTLVEGMAQVLPPLDFEMAQFVHAKLVAQGIKLHLGTKLDGLSASADDKLEAQFGGGSELFDGVVLAIGGRPNSTLAQSCGLTLNARGFIVTDEMMRTSDEHIYALGDAVELSEPLLGGRTTVALAGPANKQARILCGDIAKRFFKQDLALGSYQGAMGASAVKVFDIEAASVGFSEARLEALGQEHASIWLHPMQHAAYYPQASRCHLKLIYCSQSFKLLGAQAVGADAVKRIEIISAYLHLGGTIDDLAMHEQVYAPPFSSARDGVNYLGCVLQNIRAGLVKMARFDELKTKFKDAFLLDVRPPEMFATSHIEGFVNIPLGKLRAALDTLPRDKAIVVTCVVGISAYNACRILQQHGFNEVYDLSGGVTTYFAATAKY